MMPVDFETRLDQALKRWADSPGLDDLGVDTPELNDLVHVARRLQALAPAPVPSLVQGRRRFLAEAAHLHEGRSRLGRWIGRARARPALAFVTASVIILIIGGGISFTTGSMLSGIASTPIWDSTTPTTHPTFTATPTQVSLAPMDSARILVDRIESVQTRAPKPDPFPAPVGVTASLDTLP